MKLCSPVFVLLVVVDGVLFVLVITPTAAAPVSLMSLHPQYVSPGLQIKN
jgi:hypothetical protein